MNETENKTAEQSIEEYRKTWKKRPWAKIEAKAQEKPRPVYPVVPEEVIKRLPEHYAVQKRFSANQLVCDLIAARVIDADESTDPRWVALSQEIKEIWKKTDRRDTPPPKLYIHEEGSTLWRENHPLNVTACAQENSIHIIDQSIQTNGAISEKSRAIIAHELAHIVSEDSHIKNWEHRLKDRSNEYVEIFANRLGAILHGNPLTYAKAISQLYWDKCKSHNESVDVDHASPNRVARMTHKWAEILENNDAADRKTGDIVSMDKAVQLYNASKEWTMEHAKLDNFILDQRSR